MAVDDRPAIRAAGRAEMYGFLAALHSGPPSPAVIESLRAGSLVREIGCDPESPAARELLAHAAETRSEKDLGAELTAEYTRLFVLPSGLRPYESIYLDDKARLGGRVTIEVRRLFEKAGAALASTCIDLPDHAGMELEFMKFLCTIEGEMWRADNSSGARKALEFEAAFFENHLGRWYPILCDRILAEAAPGLYRALAHLTSGFLRSELDLLPSLQAELCEEGTATCATSSFP
ncbi:MAG: molecular chaperone TorD family protein [Planctomycetes bacterium]|nr:molecular chaperone TorD family protein [Planctomycetota bacterium]